MFLPARPVRLPLLVFLGMAMPVLPLRAQTAQPQAPAVDRAVMEQTIREALRNNRRTTAASASSQAAASLLPAISQDEIDLLDREFGLQRISGLIERKPEAFLLSLDATSFYTSNAALVPGPEQSDWVLRPGLRAAWFPRLDDDLSLLAMASYSLWRYEELHALNFDDFGAQFGLQYNKARSQLPGGMSGLNAWAHYRYQRLTSPWDWASRLYETHFLEAGARKGWRLASSVTGWLGAGTAFSIAGAPNAFRRNEHSVQAGALWQISPRVSLSLLHRFAWFDYTGNTRDDLNHLIFVGFGCQVSGNLRADLFVSGVFNHSDINAFDYQALNTGMGVVVSHAW